ncbi:acyltransferase [Myroides sp. LJL110]
MRKLIWNFLSALYPNFLRIRYGMNIGSNVRISYKANLDKSINPKGIFIGKNTWILANAMVLAHDHCRSLKADTIIGENCIIGVNSIILPGVKIGDHVIVGAGSIVTKDINSNSIVVGNPAKVVKTNIMVSDKGKLIQE